MLSARDPAGYVADTARQRSGTDRAPRAHISQVGPEPALGKTAHGVACPAAEADEEMAALAQLRRLRTRGRLRRSRQPGFEFGFGHGDDVEGHQGVLAAAIFGAL